MHGYIFAILEKGMWDMDCIGSKPQRLARALHWIWSSYRLLELFDYELNVHMESIILVKIYRFIKP